MSGSDLLNYHVRPQVVAEPDRRGVHAVAPARIRNGHVVTAGSLILLLPNVLFALHLALLPAAMMSAGSFATILILKQRRAPSDDAVLARPVALPRFAVCLCLSFALLIMGGEDHLMFANTDWLWRDSVLADLSHASFPPTYQVAGQSFFLRAPLGMYMLPALAARAASLKIGHVVLLLQNATLLTLVLYMLATIAGRRAALVVLVFLSFSGLDIVGELVMWLIRGQNLSSFVLPSQIEWWTALQYSSVVTQLFWVPNHALPCYWLALLALLYAKGELAVGTLIVVMATSLFWSPFAFIGALPFAAYFVIRDARKISALPSFWLASITALCFLPVAIYMLIDAAQVPHAFVLFHYGAVSLILLFLLIEIPHLALIRGTWSQLDPTIRGVLAMSIAFLIVLPTVRVGQNDDLLMRASIPSLFVLAFGFAQALGIAWQGKRFVLFGVGLAVALVGAVTPSLEIRRSLTFSSFAISDCNLVTVWKAIEPDHSTLENYLARRSLLPAWLIDDTRGEQLMNRPNAVCWPGIPFPPQADISKLSNAMLLSLRGVTKIPIQ